jgi:hypothetical protein
LPGQRGNPRKKLPSRFCSSSSSRKAIGISDLFILMPFCNSEDMNNSPEGYGTLAVRPTGRGNDALPPITAKHQMDSRESTSPLRHRGCAPVRRAEWKHIGNQIGAAFIFTRAEPRKRVVNWSSLVY